MFIRIKNINGQKYGYLVENDWTKKGSRQKVKKYLGKIIKLKRKTDGKFTIFNLKTIKFENIILMLVENELLAHGFIKIQKEPKNLQVPKSSIHSQDETLNYELENISVEINYTLKKIKVKKKNKNIVLELNEGFLCTESISELMQFNGHGREEQVGLKLANTALETGLKIPKDIFVELFNKKFKRLD